jgi:hypothetical protein
LLSILTCFDLFLKSKLAKSWCLMKRPNFEAALRFSQTVACETTVQNLNFRRNMLSQIFFVVYLHL